MKKKIVWIFVCTLLIVLGVFQVEGTLNNTICTENENHVKFFASDSTDDGLTEFYNDGGSLDVILARSTVQGTEKFYIVLPGQWITFFADGGMQGSVPFESFDALLCPSSTTQIWNVTAVKNVKYGPDKTKPWGSFGSYVKVGDLLKTCRYWWFEDNTNSFMNYTSGGSNYSIVPTGKLGLTYPQHIPFDPIFCNVDHAQNFADCNYGVLEAVDHACIIEGDVMVKPDYQPGFNGSYGEAFIPQRCFGPYPPHKPSAPIGPPNGSKGESYTYSSTAVDPNDDFVFYMFDWDDGTTSDWLGPVASGEQVNQPHTWTEKGTYNIKVKAKDTLGAESDWSDPLPVKIPRNKALTDTQTVLQLLLERFSNTLFLLRYILGY